MQQVVVIVIEFELQVIQESGIFEGLLTVEFAAVVVVVVVVLLPKIVILA